MRIAKVISIAGALVVSCVFLSCSPVIARGKPGNGLYELLPGSTYQSGCVGRCKCPIRMTGLSGTFVLSPESGNPSGFDISGIKWKAGGIAGKAPYTISGKGTYQKTDGKHRMKLDLSIDGDPAGFDTGFVPGGADFPDIKINLDQGGRCRNRWISIKAAPKK